MAEETYSVVWDSLSLDDLIPEAAKDAAVAVSDTVAVLSAVLDTATAAIDVLKVVLLGDIDLARAALLAIVELIDAAIEFLIATHVSTAYIVPKGYSSAVGVEQLLRLFSASMSDKTDPNRPLSSDDDNYFFIWVAIGASVNVRRLIEQFNQLMALFGRPITTSEPKRDTSFYQDALKLSDSWPPPVPTGQGQAPDWDTLRLADIGPLGTVVDALLSVRSSLEPALSRLDQLEERLLLIRERIDRIEAQINAILATVEELAQFAAASTGLVSLGIYGRGSTKTQQEALLRASLHQDYPFTGVRIVQASAGFALHVQAGTAGIIDNVRKLFGIGDSVQGFFETRFDGPLDEATESVVVAASSVKHATDGFGEDF